jgi:hypothetical protein
MEFNKKITKERFAELVRNLTDTEFEKLVYGINQITFEWGWGEDDENFDNSPLIRECWENSEDE